MSALQAAQTLKQPEVPELEEFLELASWSHLSDCSLFSNWRYFQAMLISTASQKRREAVERRIVIEDVVE
jgi:hypothetical protein